MAVSRLRRSSTGPWRRAPRRLLLRPERAETPPSRTRKVRALRPARAPPQRIVAMETQPSPRPRPPRPDSPASRAEREATRVVCWAGDGDDALRKMCRALDLRGFRFLHVLSPCPTGWKSEPALGL